MPCRSRELRFGLIPPSLIPSISFALLLQLPPFRNSDPGSHSWHFSLPPPTTVAGLICYREKLVQHFFSPRRLASNRANISDLTGLPKLKNHQKYLQFHLLLQLTRWTGSITV